MLEPAPSAAQPLLSVENLTVSYRQGGDSYPAVREVSLQVHPRQVTCLVGESGSGKTTLALAILGYLPPGAVVQSGSIHFDGRDLLGSSREQLRRIWGRELAFVPQDPMASLNPALRVGRQMAEVFEVHQGLSPRQAQREVLDMLAAVRAADPRLVAESYPHQLSGGMQQRALIGMALSAQPKLLVLDEPTTNLDVTTQAAVLQLLRELIKAHGTAALYVTHNMGVVAQICDQVVVMYAGRVVEEGQTEALFHRPLHPYTAGLLRSIPHPGAHKRLSRLLAMPGNIPAPGDLPAGCAFQPRCPLAVDICAQPPPLFDSGVGRRARCHRWEEIEEGRASPVPAAGPPAREDAPPLGDAGDILAVQDLQVHYRPRRSPLGLMGRSPGKAVRAVEGVTFAVSGKSTLGLVGESGSGKTSLALALMGLVARSGGQVALRGEPLPPHIAQRSFKHLRGLQMIFQDPHGALNPSHSVGQILSRPFQSLLGMSPAEALARVPELLSQVQLSPELMARLSGQLSAGEKQRVALARAIASRPALLIADEAVSSLDVAVQAALLNTLDGLLRERADSLLFISHDLAAVGYMADVIGVIYLGRLMEISSAAAFFQPPHHPYTEVLLAALPSVDPGLRQEPIPLEGETPSPREVIRGCPFHKRCPRALGARCQEELPPWQEGASGKRIFCHIPLAELEAEQRSALAGPAPPRGAR